MTEWYVHLSYGVILRQHVPVIHLQDYCLGGHVRDLERELWIETGLVSSVLTLNLKVSFQAGFGLFFTVLVFISFTPPFIRLIRTYGSGFPVKSAFLRF